MSGAGYGLTPRARELLGFIGEQELCPSFEEMRVAMRVVSRANIFRLLDQLEERGYIRRLRNRARAIEVIKQPDRAVRGIVNAPPIPAFIPLRGRID